MPAASSVRLLIGNKTIRAGWLIWALLGLSLSAYAQGGSNVTPAAIAPGMTAGSYGLSGIDSINPFNGRVNMHLPVYNVTGRGSANSQINMTWDSPVAYSVVTINVDGGQIYSVQGDPQGGSYGLKTGQYSVYARELASGAANPCYSGDPYVWQGTLTRLYLVEPDGTEHEMRDVATGGRSLPNGGCYSIGPSRGKKWVTTDGTGITYITDTEMRDGIQVDNEQPTGGESGWVLFKDGSRLRIGLMSLGPDPVSPSVWHDRNGNQIDWVNRKDNLNRPIPTGSTGLSGSACAALGLEDSQYCGDLVLTGFGGASRTFWLGYDAQSHPRILRLPNGLKYKFSYNEYADLIKLELPTGASIEYDYGPGLDGAQPDPLPYTYGAIPGTYYTFVYRRLLERRLYRAGHIMENRQTLSRPESTNADPIPYVEQKTYDGNGQLLGSERHYYYGNATTALTNTWRHYTPWREGKEYKTEILDHNGNVLRTSETTWEQRAPVSWWTGNSEDAPQNDPRVTQVVTTLENGLTSKVGYGYNSTVPYNSLTDVYEYDFGNGTSGALLRRTHTDYLKTLNGTDYSGSNIQLGSDPHLRDFPVQVSIFDGAGNELSRTSYEYDNYVSDANHAPLVSRPNISGLDSAITTGYITRGNVTKVTRHVLSSGETLKSYLQYDVAGNVVKTIDAGGNATTISYTDNFGSPDGEAQTNAPPVELSAANKFSYAFPTSVTNALGHIVYSQFDYYTGQGVDSKNANNIVSSVYYNDVLDRPTQTIAAVNTALKTQATTVYDDVNRVVTVTGDLNTYNDNALKSVSFYDSLGRVFESRRYETATTYVTAKNIYDGLGRVVQTSNPYRAGETVLWTMTEYDDLGRVKKVTTPDSAVLLSEYSGNTVTATEQTGKKVRSVTDALGRLLRVDEPDAATGALDTTNGVPLQPTYYTYDALGNLRKVDQGGQYRYFMYDGLSRLIRERLPEQQVNSDYNTAPDPFSGNSTWTASYEYDSSGRPFKRKDARGVEITKLYDSLSRPTVTQYSDGTPQVNYYYDNPNLPYGIGRLWKVETSGATASRTQVNTLDALGRTTSQSQWFYLNGAWSNNNVYTTTASYNLAGGIKDQTYPSGHTVTNGYDAVGRLTSFAGNLGDSTQRTYATGLTYSALGGLTQEQFGTTTPVYNKSFYNSRGQLSEIRVSTTPNDTSWNRGALINHYSGQCWGMCGGSTSGQAMTDNNGNLKKQETYIPHNDAGLGYTTWYQQYDYDALNRLQRVHEYTGNSVTDWQQEYAYDRWGNRTIQQTNTWGNNIPKPNYTIAPNTPDNRLLAPSGYSLGYDAAGNQTADSYKGQTREFDAENKMKRVLSGGQWQEYVYDGTGQRVRRKVNGVWTWQVYGLGGELLAEYAETAAPATPQKEYGYRNGQLLITAEAPGGGSSNGLAAQPVVWTNLINATAAGSTLTRNTGISDAWNGGANSAQNIPSGDGYVEMTAGSLTSSRMFGLGSNESSASYTDIEYALYLEFGYLYVFEAGVNKAYVGTLTGSDVLRVAVESGTVKYYKNGGLLYTSTTAPSYPLNVDTSIYTAGGQLSNVVIATGSGGGTPAKLTPVGVTASSSNDASMTPDKALDGDAGTMWNAGGSAPRWIQPDLGQSYAVTKVRLQVAQYPNGATTHEVWGGATAGSLTLLGTLSGTTTDGQWLEVNFAATNLRYVKVVTTASPSWVAWKEIEIYGTPVGGSSSGSGGVNWLVTDQLGTPRMVVDQTGSLSGVKRHDYLPFGEELYANAGRRSEPPGYGGADSVRQQFTGYERDDETGLDYAQARYFSSSQGRFTGVDPLMDSAMVNIPQTWNRYNYVANNPLKYIDPSGMYITQDIQDEDEKQKDKRKTPLKGWLNREDDKDLDVYFVNSRDYFAEGVQAVYSSLRNSPSGSLRSTGDSPEATPFNPINVPPVVDMLLRTNGERHITAVGSYKIFSAGVSRDMVNGVFTGRDFIVIGLGPSLAKKSGSLTNWPGLNQPGVFIQGQACYIMCINGSSPNLLHPRNSSFTLEPGAGSPNVGAGVYLYIPYNQPTAAEIRYIELKNRMNAGAGNGALYHPGYAPHP